MLEDTVVRDGSKFVISWQSKHPGRDCRESAWAIAVVDDIRDESAGDL
jgi:hypothetical protein